MAKAKKNSIVSEAISKEKDKKKYESKVEMDLLTDSDIAIEDKDENPSKKATADFAKLGELFHDEDKEAKDSPVALSNKDIAESNDGEGIAKKSDEVVKEEASEEDITEQESANESNDEEDVNMADELSDDEQEQIMDEVIEPQKDELESKLRREAIMVSKMMVDDAKSSLEREYAFKYGLSEAIAKFKSKYPDYKKYYEKMLSILENSTLSVNGGQVPYLLESGYEGLVASYNLAKVAEDGTEDLDSFLDKNFEKILENKKVQDAIIEKYIADIDEGKGPKFLSVREGASPITKPKKPKDMDEAARLYLKSLK